MSETPPRPNGSGQGNQSQAYAYNNDSYPGETEESRKRKRNRAILSCTNCKARKVKCDRQSPCENCIKRGISSSCRWTSSEVTPPSQVYALESVLESVREHFEARLSRVEAALNLQNIGTSEEVVRAATEETWRKTSVPTPPASRAIKEHSATLEDAEDAALALEVLAVRGIHPKPEVITDRPRDARASSAEFAYNSLILQNYKSPFPQSTRIPWTQNMTLRTLVTSFLQIVTTQARAESMLGDYLEFMGWLISSIHVPSLRREHAAFWQIVATPSFHQIDPAWIALYAAILSIAVEFTPVKHPDISRFELHQIVSLGLELAEWRSKPQIRVCQTLMILDIFHFASGELATSSIYQAAGLRVAQALNLDDLGTDPAVMPREDRAFPSGTLLAREMGVRIWCEIVAYDWGCAEFPEFHYVITPGSFTTGPPKCLTDDDIDTGEWDMPSRPFSERPDASLHPAKIMLGEMQRQLRDLGPPPPGNGEDLKLYYDSIMKLDRGIHSDVTKLYVPEGFCSQSIANWHILLHQLGLQARMLRLHRPLMARGYTIPEVAYSTKTAIDAAGEVISLFLRIDRIDAPTAVIWFLHRHVMTAILALTIDALHGIDTGVYNPVTEEKLTLLPEVIRVFQKAESYSMPAIADLSKKGHLLIQGLMDATEARKQAKSTGKVEEYSTVLRRVHTTVHKNSMTPISSTNGSPANVPANWLDDAQTRDLLSSIGLLSYPGNQGSAPTWVYPNQQLSTFSDNTLWNFSSESLAHAAGLDVNLGGSAF